MMELWDTVVNATAFANWSWANMLMNLIAIVFIYLAIKKHYEPLLLIPIALGILLGNVMPITIDGSAVSFTDINAEIGGNKSVSYYIYFGVQQGFYPPLIFMGIGAMTDFSFLLSRPRLVLLGAAAQFGIFITYAGALFLGFTQHQAGAIGIIGGADGPTAIFLSSVLAYCPVTASLVFDVRFLPNPFFEQNLRTLAGDDEEVAAWLSGFSEVDDAVTRIVDLISYLLPRYSEEMKTHVGIALGCTGGRHRSVYVADRVARTLTDAGHEVVVHHRDKERWRYS